MYVSKIPESPFTTTIVKIIYDCCSKEHSLKCADANKNFEKNNGKHICRTCWLKNNNPAKTQAAKDKAKQTNLDRYGSTIPMNSKENIEKRKEQFKNEEFKAQWVEKHKQTCLDRYGVEHQMHVDEVKAKVKTTNLERYGVEVPLQNTEILAKAQATNLERYGDVCSLNNPEVKAKALKTLFENFGVEYYNQLPEMKDYLRENCTIWLAESYANPWAKGITRPEEWNDKQRETVAKLFELGQWKGGGKNSLKGTYASIKCRKTPAIFRSSYELKTHWHLDNDPNVEWYDYEPFQIIYEDTEGKKRHYTIDFVVQYALSKKLLAIEVKNSYTEKSEITNIKYKAFMEHCANELDHEFWSNDKIKSLNLDIKDLLTSDKVQIWE